MVDISKCRIYLFIRLFGFYCLLCENVATSTAKGYSTMRLLLSLLQKPF